LRVLGIDPGLVVTGYGVLDRIERGQVRLIDAGTIDSGSPKDPLALRLRRIYEEMMSLIVEHSPDAMALEQLYSHYDHPRTSILMGHARGVICLAAAMHDLPVHHYPSTQVKSALTGNGRASKQQIGQMVQRTFGLVEIPHPADVSDAVAIALCHLSHEGNPIDAYLRSMR
jgi:crossover junction endodeoxyribonuclease RuvC